MSRDPNDVVRVAAGEMVTVELYKQALVDNGIQARVVGESLEASFGTAIPGSVELWVHQGEAEAATRIIAEFEAEGRKAPHERVKFPHPESTPNPHRKGGHGPHTHYDANPGN